MVTKKENPQVTQFTRDLARVIKGLARENSVTQAQIAQAIGKSQPYVSHKMNGLDAWSTYELEKIGELLGFEHPFEIFRVAEVRLRQ